MRKLVVSEFLSLDGVMENPAWTAPYWNDEAAAFKAAEMETTTALLQGRVTYEGMAAAWPARGDEDPGARIMNSLPKYVVSATLTEASWNNSTIIRGDVAQAVTALKAQDGGDILVYGSGQLTRFLLEYGLVDQLNLLVYPVTLGSGKRLFGEVPVNLKLTGSRAFSSGVVLLQYVPETSS